ncbi:Zinc/iron permease [Entophlyctis helioformis]|nr:Zinc/iron permease [Entophlyctis helioformis]
MSARSAAALSAASAASAAALTGTQVCFSSNSSLPATYKNERYNLPLHIAAIFIIIAISFVGTMLPIAANALLKHGVHGMAVVQHIKLFGVGVILATSLVYKFVPSHKQLAAECLPDVITDNFDVISGGVALFGVLLTHTLHLVAAKALYKLGMRALESDSAAMYNFSYASQTLRSSFLHLDEGGAHSHVPGSLIYHKHRHWRMYIIELFIAVHSLIFGLSLGASQEKFGVLMVAVSFHQFIEGEALSNLVMDAEDQDVLAIITVVSYTLVTPLGIALGIIMGGLFFENSWQAVFAEGVLNSLSAGMLLYDALVNIMVPHFQASKFRRASSLQQALELATLWAGACAMVFVGQWL